ncbi:unnamed protein product [Linum trigynum]|uniref:Secreted protein n=1 Tax=Linum trigynum TaxID=586398 RepID=A0AAV2FNG7_9ROSI
MRGALSSLLVFCLRSGQFLLACLSAMLNVVIANQAKDDTLKETQAVEGKLRTPKNTPGRTAILRVSGGKRSRPLQTGESVTDFDCSKTQHLTKAKCNQ